MGFYFGNPVSKIDQEKKTCQNISLDKLQLNVDPKENREQMKQNTQLLQAQLAQQNLPNA